MVISQAPNMVFDAEALPGYCRAFANKGKNGYTFNQSIRDSIVFEYHDILNANALPELDIILARDILSFIPLEAQEKITAGFGELLKSRGVIFLGKNEAMPGNEWQRAGNGAVSAFVRAG